MGFLGLFFDYFWSFSNNKKYRSSQQRWDSSPGPFDHECPPITTIPGIQCMNLHVQNKLVQHQLTKVGCFVKKIFLSSLQMACLASAQSVYFLSCHLYVYTTISMEWARWSGNVTCLLGFRTFLRKQQIGQESSGSGKFIFKYQSEMSLNVNQILLLQSH